MHEDCGIRFVARCRPGSRCSIVATMDGRALNSFAYATPTVVHSFGGAAAVGDVTQHQQQARRPQQAQHLPMSDEPPSLFAPSVQSTQVEGLEAGKWSAEQPKDTGTSEEEEVDRLMEIWCLDEQGISVCRMLL